MKRKEGSGRNKKKESNEEKRRFRREQEKKKVMKRWRGVRVDHMLVKCTFLFFFWLTNGLELQLAIVFYFFIFIL